jgi:hypothetical protein|tara:strand:- start:454 stop:1119 length:666 start_codon:yes stop_codon:yes gene_type:complete
MSGKIIALRAMTNKQMQAVGSDLSYGPIVIGPVLKRELFVREFQTKHGLSVDGWPGDKTYYSLWSAGYRPATREAIISYARDWCNIGTTYKLGSGGYEWLPDFPSTELDCSGFVASVLGRSRKPQVDFPYWLSTDSIWGDCADKQRLFKQIVEPVPGCLVVYPDSNGRQGHVGIVSGVENDWIRGIDCSSITKDDAVTERNLSFFLLKSDVRFCLPVWLQE